MRLADCQDGEASCLQFPINHSVFNQGNLKHTHTDTKHNTRTSKSPAAITCTMHTSMDAAIIV